MRTKFCPKCMKLIFISFNNNNAEVCVNCKTTEKASFCNFCSECCISTNLRKHELSCSFGKIPVDKKSKICLTLVVLDRSIIPMIHLFFDYYRDFAPLKKFEIRHIACVFPLSRSNDEFDFKLLTNQLCYMNYTKEKQYIKFYVLKTKKILDETAIKVCDQLNLMPLLNRAEIIECDTPNFLIPLELFLFDPHPTEQILKNDEFFI